MANPKSQEGTGNSLVSPALNQESVFHVLDSLLEGLADAVLIFSYLEERRPLFVQCLDYASTVPHQPFFVEPQLR